mgnify:CR=1 FL=1
MQPVSWRDWEKKPYLVTALNSSSVSEVIKKSLEIVSLIVLYDHR